MDQLKSGTLLSYLQMALSVIIGIVYTPVMIRLLGQNEYGLYNTVASTISMLSVLSLGFNSGYIRYYARYKKEKRKEATYRLNGMFLLIFSIIGAIAFLCGLYLTNHLQLVFSKGLTSEEYRIARILMLLLTINLSVSFPMSVFQTIISAHERFVYLKMLGVLKTVLGPMLTMPVLLAGYGSIGMVTVTLVVSFLTDLLYLFYTTKRLKERFVFGSFEKGLLKSLLGYSGFIALNIIIDQINWNIDKTLLGRFRGTAEVAVYSVGFSLYHYYMLISTSISGVFTPRIHRIYNEWKEQPEELDQRFTELFIRVSRIQYLVLGLVASGVAFFGQVFIHYWVGDGFENAYFVALLLIFPASIALIQSLGIEIQRAENRHQFRSIVYALMALINLGLSIWLCQIYGAVGSAIGTAISLIAANGLIMNVYYYKKCGIDIPLFWKNMMRMLPGAIPPVLFGILITKVFPMTSVLRMAICILMYVVVYACSVWLLSMNDYEKELIRSFVRKIGKGKNKSGALR